MKAKSRIASLALVVLAVLVAIPIISYALENRQLRAERSRVHSLIHVGQSIGDAQQTLAQSGFRFLSDTPTRYLSYQQLLVIIGDPTPSNLDTLCYVIGCANPLRDQSPYVVIAAGFDGVITEID